MLKEHVIDPLSVILRLVTLMVCSVFISAKQPVEQFHLKLLLTGGGGETKHVKLRLDPTRYSLVLLTPSTGKPTGLVTMLVLYGATDQTINEQIYKQYY